jgi:ABC-type transporter Mla subunit MlaD
LGIQSTEKAGFMGKGLTHREKTFGLLFLLMAAIALVTIAMLVQEKGWFASQRVYVVRFAQGHNIQKGDPVKISNTDIGKVTGIGIFRGLGMVSVEITIKVRTENAHLIRQDSVATVVHPAQGGRAYLEITPGSLEYPPMGEYDIIPSRGLKTLQ